MRIVILNDFAHVNGGAASVAIASAVGLARRGHDVIFFSAVAPIDPELEKAGVCVICTKQYEILKDPRRIRAAIQGVWNHVAARDLALRLRSMECQDTVVHLHGWSKALSSSVVRATTARGFKIVCTLHDYFCACPTGGFFDAKNRKHCHLQPLSTACIARNCDTRSYGQKLWRVVRQFTQEKVGRIPAGIDAFIVLSRLSRAVLQPYLPENTRLFEVPNPVHVTRDSPVSVEANRAFTMVGQLSPAKGGDLFAAAARDAGVQALFVGDGPSRDEITAANPAAVITGWVSHASVGEHFLKARAIVFPSLWYEAQPLAVLEAAARGIPAIVSDGCAAAESVRDEVTGLLFRSGDVPSLAAALRRLCDDRLVQRLGRAAYEAYWADPPALERHVSAMEKVYQTVLGFGREERSEPKKLAYESDFASQEQMR